MPPLLRIGRISIAAGLLLAPPALAGELSAIAIDFAPPVTTKLQRYGAAETAARIRAGRYAREPRGHGDGAGPRAHPSDS